MVADSESLAATSYCIYLAGNIVVDWHSFATLFRFYYGRPPCESVTMFVKFCQHFAEVLLSISFFFAYCLATRCRSRIYLSEAGMSLLVGFVGGGK